MAEQQNMPPKLPPGELKRGEDPKPLSPAELLERVVIRGDLAQLSPLDRMQYYNRVCTSLGLNPVTRPFEYLQLQGGLKLYAKKDATDQLRKLYHVSIEITARGEQLDLYVVQARAFTPDGRTDESMGAVWLKGLAGEALANALMKAETKAKRRATLSICGLGFLDESEVDDALAADRAAGGGRESPAKGKLDAALAARRAALAERPGAPAPPDPADDPGRDPAREKRPIEREDPKY